MAPITQAPRAPYLLKALLLVVLLTAASFAQAGDAKGYLGVHLQDLDASMQKALQMGDQTGVLVNDVVDDGPAGKAGVEDGDVIVKFGSTAIASSEDLVAAVAAARPGDEVKLTVLRGGKEKKLDVTVGEREEKEFVWTHPKMQKLQDGDGPHGFRWLRKDGDGDGDIEIYTDGDIGEGLFFAGGNCGYLGIQMDDLSGQLGDYFGVQDGKGVLVTEVVEDSPAAQAGLKAGDVIVELAGEKIESTADLHKTMQGTEADQKVTVVVRRKGDGKSFDVTLGERPKGQGFGNMMFLDGDESGNFTVRAPRMRMHMPKGSWLSDSGDDVKERRIIIEKNDDEMDALRDELQNLKKELQDLKKDLKK